MPHYSKKKSKPKYDVEIGRAEIIKPTHEVTIGQAELLEPTEVKMDKARKKKKKKSPDVVISAYSPSKKRMSKTRTRSDT